MVPMRGREGSSPTALLHLWAIRAEADGAGAGGAVSKQKMEDNVPQLVTLSLYDQVVVKGSDGTAWTWIQ